MYMFTLLKYSKINKINNKSTAVVLVESSAASFMDKFRDITCDNVTLVTRKEWGARPPKKIVHMNTPVTVLFIHHTDMQSCHTKEDCIKMMRIIQDFHMDERGLYGSFIS